ncbi:L-lactate permease [Bradymonadaceae bacterium TMQ3]|nr:L-lactate permease [Bradymonadaceae bacterium TMQ3]TXC75514.1 L-lactate permease [Bradymonadales bacterium TMQ1]
MTWWLEALLAASPIALILVAMLLFKRSAATAGAFGLLLTLALTFLHFGFPSLSGVDAPLTIGLAGSLAEASFTAASILWIIFGALCIHRLQLHSGAIDALRAHLGRLTDDPRLMAILIAWFFALFLEGAAGFGTPAALTAPFLVAFGFPAVHAVAITLIGYAVGVSFGALGTPIMVQLASTDVDPLNLGRVTSDLSVPVGALLLALMLWQAHRCAASMPSHRTSPRSIASWYALAACGCLLPMALIARHLGPELPTLGGAVVGASLFIIALKLRRHSDSDTPQPLPEGDAPQPSTMPLYKAASPYLIVILLVLLTRQVAPLNTLLRSLDLSWQLFDHFQAHVEPLFHPGTILLLAFLTASRIQATSWRATARAAITALHMILPITLALLAMLSISRLMVHAHMVDALAEAAAHTGATWPLLAPLVGALGTFVTGSATASNILFTDFQLAAANHLGLDPLRLIGAQGAGAAIGNTIAPHSIIAGCATVGISGHEADVLKRTLLPALLALILAGLLVKILAG